MLSLVPLSKKGSNIAVYIKRVIDIISELKNLTISQLDLVLGILWLTTDKFVEDTLERNIICDMLGDRMTLMHEYGENKYKKGIEKIIANLLKAGDEPEIIAKKTDVQLDEILEIKEKYAL